MLFAFGAGFAIGIVRWTGNRYLEPICWVYIEFARNTPPLVQILFWYFSAIYLLPHWLFEYMRDVGFQFAAAVFALSIYHAAFVAETVRAGLNSISRDRGKPHGRSVSTSSRGWPTSSCLRPFQFSFRR